MRFDTKFIKLIEKTIFICILNLDYNSKGDRNLKTPIYFFISYSNFINLNYLKNFSLMDPRDLVRRSTLMNS